VLQARADLSIAVTPQMTCMGVILLDYNGRSRG
jgi:hypothetical protein